MSGSTGAPPPGRSRRICTLAKARKRCEEGLPSPSGSLVSSWWPEPAQRASSPTGPGTGQRCFLVHGRTQRQRQDRKSSYRRPACFRCRWIKRLTGLVGVGHCQLPPGRVGRSPRRRGQAPTLVPSCLRPWSPCRRRHQLSSRRTRGWPGYAERRAGALAHFHRAGVRPRCWVIA